MIEIEAESKIIKSEKSRKCYRRFFYKSKDTLLKEIMKTVVGTTIYIPTKLNRL